METTKMCLLELTKADAMVKPYQGRLQVYWTQQGYV